MGANSVETFRTRVSVQPVVLVLAGLLVVALLVPVPGHGATAGDLEWKPIQFAADDESTKVAAELGTLWVRERWADSASALIGLNLVRFRATSRHPGPPIVYLAGGPGGSGTRAAAGKRFRLFMALREVADVVALDQRGVLSQPYPVCREPIVYPTDTPLEPELGLRLLRERAQACIARWRHEGIDPAAYHTDASADDLEALRRALGTDKISLWGISYGTHLGLAMLRRHGASVHRAVLAGVEGPDHTWKLPRTFDRHLDSLGAMIRRDAKVGDVVPDLVASLRRILTRLEREPVVVVVEGGRAQRRDTVAVGPFDLQLALLDAIGERRGIARIPAGIVAMERGDFRGLGRASLRQRAASSRPLMAYTMNCASGGSRDRIARIERESRTSLLGPALDFPDRRLCDVWPHQDLGDAFRGPMRSGVPTLFLSGSLDPRTPPSNAEEILPGFPHGRHLVIENAGHDDDLLISSPLIGQAIADFLSGRPVPDRILLPPIPFESPGP